MEIKERLVEIIDSLIIIDRDFQEALEIVRRNSSGSIWLIGGFLYKNLAHGLYGSKKSTKDFDLIVEEANDELILPEGWGKTLNHFKGIKFVNGEKKIDFIPLANVYYIQAKGLVPNIANFLEGGGLNVHCIAYDISGGQVLGEVGINALEQRVISAYNLEMLQYGASLYGKTPNDMIKKKAEELGFRPKLL